MPQQRGYPLDYQADDYRYIERPNATLIEVVKRHTLAPPAAFHDVGILARPRVLDIGAGAGANLRALRAFLPGAHFTAVEPNQRAAELLKQACNDVHQGTVESFLATRRQQAFDVVLLSDVIEHIADPVALLRGLRNERTLGRALFFVSIPNYAVWYNRLSTLLGRFDYTWSGLFDRTHLRFFTLRSQNRLFAHVGFELLEQRATPSLAQSLAPWLRRSFESSVDAGEHLALEQSRAYRTYARLVEPLETRVCELWPELLGFQIVSVLKPS